MLSSNQYYTENIIALCVEVYYDRIYRVKRKLTASFLTGYPVYYLPS